MLAPHRILVVTAVVLLAACSSGTSQSPGATSSGPRTIALGMTDELRFKPAEITVRAGETVRFEVTNGGQMIHDFFIGDEDAQDDHEAEMGGMSGMGDDTPSSLSLDPGAMKTLDFTFPADPGALLIGCHEPGHYAAGMVATVTIEG